MTLKITTDLIERLRAADNRTAVDELLAIVEGPIRPRLFYFEPGVGALILAPDRLVNIVDTSTLAPDETIDVQFKRVDLTDAEYDALLDA